MNAYFRGQLLTGPRGPAGPDGNPVGTVISFMGTAAPKDYLICDGAEHSVKDYPALAEFFREQFGAANHFGGDGEATFAVPDMRNLFLRGFHGEAEEALSGEVGERQEATEFNNVYSARGNSGNGSVFAVNNNIATESSCPRKADSIVSIGRFATRIAASLTPYDVTGVNNEGYNSHEYYTSRPVNMAVLYCIKAVESAALALEEYDTEDGWHVRKWPDGYVELEGTVDHTVQSTDWQAWGGIYSLKSDHSIDPYPYPIQLTQIYGETFDITLPYDSAVIVMHKSRVSNDKTKAYSLARGTVPGTLTGKLHYHVTGRWK